MIRWTRCCHLLLLCFLAYGCHAAAPRVASLPAAPEPIIFKYFQPVAPRASAFVAPPVMPAPSVPSYESLRQERLRLCIARFHATDPAERDALFFQIDAIDNLLDAHYAAEMASGRAQRIVSGSARSRVVSAGSSASDGLPALDMTRPVKVRGYTRDDGTYVRPSTRNYPTR